MYIYAHDNCIKFATYSVWDESQLLLKKGTLFIDIEYNKHEYHDVHLLLVRMSYVVKKKKV